MNPISLGLLSIVCYLISTIMLAKDIITEKTRFHSIYPAWAAVIIHFAYLTVISMQYHRIDFSFFNMASITSAIITLLLLLAGISKPIEKLGIAIFPIALSMLALSMAFPGKERILQNYSWQMSTHILSSVIAFSLLSIAALQAIFLAIQEQQLRKHPPQRIILSLPPLQTMESLLFQMITTGVVFLSVSLISGFIFIDDLFAQHLVHKTVLSIVAWIIFTGLLLGRARYGWRGQPAIRWTLIGFTLLLLAYFGSKLVLELILNRP